MMTADFATASRRTMPRAIIIHTAFAPPFRHISADCAAAAADAEGRFSYFFPLLIT